MNLDKPKTQKAEVLRALLTRNGITRAMMIRNILNLPARIMDLRRDGLNIELTKIKVKNKHTRPTSYGVWSLPAEEKEKALQIYAEINGENK